MDPVDTQTTNPAAPDNTQGTPEGNTTTPNGGGTPPAVQQRFDELTAEKYALKARADSLETQMQHLLGTLANMSVQQRAAPEPAVDENGNPDISKLVQQAVQNAMGPVNNALSQLSQGQTQVAFHQTAAKYSPQVQAKAQELMTRWRAEGKSGWNVEDAFIFAKGLLPPEPASRATPPVVTHAAAPPPASAPQNQKRVTVPPEYYSWSMEQQASFWLRNGSNIPDEPI